MDVPAGAVMIVVSAGLSASPASTFARLRAGRSGLDPATTAASLLLGQGNLARNVNSDVRRVQSACPHRSACRSVLGQRWRRGNRQGTTHPLGRSAHARTGLIDAKTFGTHETLIDRSLAGKARPLNAFGVGAPAHAGDEVVVIDKRKERVGPVKVRVGRSIGRLGILVHKHLLRALGPPVARCDGGGSVVSGAVQSGGSVTSGSGGVLGSIGRPTKSYSGARASTQSNTSGSSVAVHDGSVPMK